MATTPTSAPLFPPSLTSREARKRLNVCRPKIYELLRSGALQGFKIGRDWRISEASIAEFVKRGGVRD